MFYGLPGDGEDEARKQESWHKQTSEEEGPGENKAGRGGQLARDKPLLLSKVTCVICDTHSLQTELTPVLATTKIGIPAYCH